MLRRTADCTRSPGGVRDRSSIAGLTAPRDSRTAEPIHPGSPTSCLVVCSYSVLPCLPALADGGHPREAAIVVTAALRVTFGSFAVATTSRPPTTDQGLLRT